MTRNIHCSATTGRLYDIHSYDVVCRREIPERCHHCDELMYHEIVDTMMLYDVLLCACRNGHERVVFIDKREEV